MFEVGRQDTKALNLRYWLCVTLSTCALLSSDPSFAEPQGGHVVGGSATISQSEGSTTIHQTSHRGIIKWNSFDVGSLERVEFQQPNTSSITVNRIIDTKASQINGHITANGQIVLLNQNGIVFGSGSRVDAAGVVAASSDIDNDVAFMAGDNLHLTRSQNPEAKIINNGTMTVQQAGLVGLVAPHVENNGVINARLGKVTLASGDKATIDLAGDGLIQVEISDAVLRQNIKNSGIISADGGVIRITASDAHEIVSGLIENTGHISAKTTTQKKGKIDIKAPKSTIQNTGVIEVTGGDREDGGTINIETRFVSLGGAIRANGKNGGSLNIKGQTVSLADTLDAKGFDGNGGNILIESGGQTWETSTSHLNVDGTENGGHIRVTSLLNHSSSGRYSARGKNGAGGKIDMTAGGLKLLSAQMDASGKTAGGRIRIGGEFQGGKGLLQDELQNAQITTLDRGTRLLANGEGYEADGGSVIVWSDFDTLSMAEISATPGINLGVGGFVEISSGDILSYDSKVETGRGDRAGTVLLDPKNIQIANSTFNSTAIIMGRGVGTGASGNNVNIPSLNYGGEFGAYSSVSLDGNRMAVGWLNDLGADGLGGRDGAVWLYTFTDSSFSGAVLEGIMGRGYTGGKNVNVPLDTSWDRFGTSVSLDGNRLAIGAFAGDGATNGLGDSGEVYLYTFSDSAFNGATLQSRIGHNYTGGKNFNMTPYLNGSDFFGWSLSLDGNRLAVGAREGDGFGNTVTTAGEVYLFSFADASFSTPVLQSIIGNGYTGGKNINQALDPSDRFGWSVSLNGNRLAVGAYLDDGLGNTGTDFGATYLYSFTDSVFSGGILESIIGRGYTGGKNIDTTAFANNFDYLGYSVSLDSNRLAIGLVGDDANGNSSGDSGAVYLYSFTDSVFSGGITEARIGNNYNALGGKNLSRPNEATGSDNFGASVSLDGNRLVIGASGDDGASNRNINQGAYHYYTFTDAAFTGGTYQGTLGNGYTGGKNINFINTSPDNVNERMSVSLSDNRIAIGVPYADGFNDSLGDSGEVYLYSFANSNFDSAVLESMIGAGYIGGKNIDISAGLGTSDGFGHSVSLDGNRLAVGSIFDDGRTNTLGDSGAVYLFTFTDSLFSGGVLESRIGQNYGALGGKNFSVTNIGGNDWFGSALSLDGNRLVISAARDDGNANSVGDSGAVYLFTFADSVFSTPTLQGIIGAGYGALGGKNFSIANLGSSDILGEYNGVSLDGNRLAVTARGDDGFGNTRSEAGAVYLFTFADSVFTTPTLQSIMGYGYTGGKNINMTILDTSDQLTGVALEGSTLALGAIGDDGFGNTSNNTGAIHIYNFDDLLFSNGQYDATIGFNYTGGKNINTSGTIDSTDFMGASLDLNNGVLVTSLPGFDGGNGTGASPNGNTYNNSGGVFIYRGNSNPVSNGTSFSTVSTSTIGITPANITALLNTPQNVILQASNDIIVDDALIVNNLLGNGGNLTLQAGRSIFVNANITTDNGDLNLYANEDLSTGVVNAQRDAGAAVINMAAGTTINAGTGNVHIRLEDGTGKTNNTSGFITLNNISAGTLLVHSIVNTSSIVVNGTLTATGTGTPLTIAAGKDFINNLGASALSTPSGRWLVYSDSPLLNTTGGLIADFELYNCSYLGACGALGANNGLLYEYGLNLITVSVNTSRLYGDANPNNSTLQSLFVYNGFQNGDTVSVLDVLPTASIAGTANATAAGGTTHAITLTGGSDNFYSYYLLDPSLLTINARPLTATWTGPLTKTYGDANPSPSYTILNYTGFVNSETIGAYNPNFAVNYGAVTTATGVGSYSIAPTWSSGGNFLLNYTITPPTGTLNITPRSITASWTGSLTKTYGDANPAVTTSNFTYTGLVNGDTGAVLTPTANFGIIDATSNTGTYTNGVSSTFSAANYSVSNTPLTTLIINKRNVTATVSGKSRAYGDANPSWAKADVTYTNLVNGDTATGMDTVVLTTPSLTVTNNVGTTQNITITSFLDNNYNLTGTTAGILSINKRDITATVSNKSRIYGDANPSWNTISDVTYTNLVNSDTSSGMDTVVLTIPSLTVTNNVGTTQNITITSFLDNNYNLTGTTAGILSINKRDITAVVQDKTRYYGYANPTWNSSEVSWINLANSETGNVIDSFVVTAPTAMALSGAGTSHIATLSSLLDNNYNLIGQTSGFLAITQAPLTLSVNDAQRPAQTADPVFGYKLIGLRNSEDSSVVSGVTLSSTAVQSSPAGRYIISASGGSSLNYIIVSYLDGEFLIRNANSLPATAEWAVNGNQFNDSKQSSVSKNLVFDAHCVDGEGYTSCTTY